MRTTILIDGQNLFHTLRDFKIQEQNLAWDRIFASLLSGEQEELLGVYWFRPKEISEIYLTRRNISKRLFHNEYKNREKELNGLFNQRKLPREIHEKIEKIYKQNLDWLKKEKQIFSSIRNKYWKLAKTYNEIQLVETGFLKVDPYTRTRLGEKGVDVAIAIKLVELALTDMCDKIILFSGDLDFYEAIKVAQENRKRIEVVKFEGPSRPSQSLSKIIEQLADKIIPIKEKDLKTIFSRSSGKKFPAKQNKQEEMANFRKRINRIMMEDKIDEALDRMQEKVEGKIRYIEKEIILVKSSFHNFKSNFRKGIMSSSEATLRRAKIRNTVLDILDEIIKELKK